MITQEAINWLIGTNDFILVPCSSQTLASDIGKRSKLVFDDTNLLNESLYRLCYTEDSFFIRIDYNVEYFYFLLGGKTTNPIYSSNYNSNDKKFTFINFDLSGFEVGDKILICDSENLEELLETEILSLNLLENSISIVDNLIDSNRNRYKIISTNGLYGYIQNIDYKNIINHNRKFSCKVYAGS